MRKIRFIFLIGILIIGGVLLCGGAFAMQYLWRYKEPFAPPAADDSRFHKLSIRKGAAVDPCIGNLKDPVCAVLNILQCYSFMDNHACRLTENDEYRNHLEGFDLLYEYYIYFTEPQQATKEDVTQYHIQEGDVIVGYLKMVCEPVYDCARETPKDSYGEGCLSNECYWADIRPEMKALRKKNDSWIEVNRFIEDKSIYPYSLPIQKEFHDPSQAR